MNYGFFRPVSSRLVLLSTTQQFNGDCIQRLFLCRPLSFCKLSVISATRNAPSITAILVLEHRDGLILVYLPQVPTARALESCLEGTLELGQCWLSDAWHVQSCIQPRRLFCASFGVLSDPVD